MNEQKQMVASHYYCMVSHNANEIVLAIDKLRKTAERIKKLNVDNLFAVTKLVDCLPQENNYPINFPMLELGREIEEFSKNGDKNFSITLIFRNGKLTETHGEAQHESTGNSR